MAQAVYLKEITVFEDGSEVGTDMCVFKHENGGVFAIDSSYIDQCLEEGDDESVLIPDPFVDYKPGAKQTRLELLNL